MKNKFISAFRCRPVTGGLLLGLACLLWSSAGAQVLKNGNFESPFPISDPTAGWTLVFVDGGPGDFAIAGQTTEASYCCGGRGAQFRSGNNDFAHAYFKQVVTNVTSGLKYTLSIQKMRAGFKYAEEGTPPRLKVYASMISGASSNAVHGYSTNIGPYSLAITAGANQIEVQLHMARNPLPNESSEDYKSSKCNAWFDNFSLLTEQAIQSIQASNGVVIITWNSVAGQTYRVQYRTDIMSPDWTDLSPDVVAAGPTASKTDTYSGSLLRYYRVMRVLQ
jgi:hypothetical protein